MAREAVKARERKRQKLVARYAEKERNLKLKVTTLVWINFQETHLQFVCTTDVS